MMKVIDLDLLENEKIVTKPKKKVRRNKIGAVVKPAKNTILT